MKKNIEKIKKFVKKNWIYISLFIFIYIVSVCLPLTGDDWGNYKPMSFFDSFKQAYNGYVSHESRWASRILITQLVYYKWLWEILNAICFTSIFWSIINIFDIKEKVTQIILAIGMLAIPCAMFAQVYAWVVGSITYFFPVAIILAYIAYLFKTKKYINKKNIICIILLNFITPFFVDHMAITLLVTNIFYLIYLKLNKEKITIYNYIIILVSFLSILGVVFAPGNMNRLATVSEFETLNLIEKIFYNIPQFIHYTFYANVFLIFLMLVPINFCFIKLLKQKYATKYLVLIFFNIIPIYTIIKMFYQNIVTSNFNNALSFDFYFESHNSLLSTKYGYCFWLLFAIIFLASILYIFKDKKEKIFHILLLFIGLSANAAMLISPIWGYRTTFFTTIILYGITISLINHIMREFKYSGNDVIIFLKVILFSIMIFYSGCFVFIKNYDEKRINNIRNQYTENCEFIDIEILPLKIIHNYNMYWEFHQDTYKTYLFNAEIIQNEDIKLNIIPFKKEKEIYFNEK